MRIPNNLPPEKLEALFALAGKGLGISPEVLKEKLSGGSYDGLLDSLTPEQASKLQGVMNNPKMIAQLLSDPKIQALLKK